MEIKPIAKIKNGFNEKFGIPRQSGLCDSISFIVLEKEYSVKEAFRGIEEYSHLWLIWEFNDFSKEQWSPTVRPPRLGGNKRVGVFATRSPNRPNSLGLSSVKLLSVTYDKENRVVLEVAGADLMDGTLIYDIKPYVKYSDSHEDAVSGFAEDFSNYKIEVSFSDEILENYPEELLNEIESILSNDPKPSYHKDDFRVYGMSYYDYDVRFKYVDRSIKVFEITQNNKK